MKARDGHTGRGRRLEAKGSPGPPAPRPPGEAEPPPAPLTFFLSRDERESVLRRLRAIGGSRATALLELVGRADG